MAKQSARSKGYRKYHKEVKGYTPQEKKAMIIGFSVIAVILIAVLVLPDFIESFSLLKVKDGVIQDLGDNWLVANTGTSSKAKYRKMAEVGEIEGYTLASTEPGFTDENLQYFVFEPASEDSVAQTLNVQPGNGEAAELAETFRSQMGNFGEVLSMSEVEEAEINGMKTYLVAMQYRYESPEAAIAEAETETAEALTEELTGEEVADETETETEPAEEEIVYDYTQSVVLYIDSNIGDKCIVLNAMNTGDSESAFADDEAMREVVRTAAAAITLE